MAKPVTQLDELTADSVPDDTKANTLIETEDAASFALGNMRMTLAELGKHGRKPFDFTGAWNGGTAYTVGQVVTAPDGLTYRCTTGHTNHQPPNASYWVLVALPTPAGATAGMRLRVSADGSKIGLLPDFEAAAVNATAYPNVATGAGQATANDALMTAALVNFADATKPDYAAGVDLPPGTFYVGTSGIVLLSSKHSGFHLRGRGRGKTSLITAGGFPIGVNLANSSLGTAANNHTDGDTIGYLLHANVSGASSFRAGDTAGDAEAANLVVGDCVILFHDNATQVRNQQQQVAKIASKVAVGGGLWDITLAVPINATYFPVNVAYKIIKNSRLVSSISGATVTMTTHADAANFVPGTWCRLTDGAAINDLYGEAFRVFASDGTAGTVLLDHPPELPYVAGRMALIPGPWLEDVHLDNLATGYCVSHGDIRLVAKDSDFFNPEMNLAASWGAKIIRCRGYFDLDCVEHADFDNCDIYGLSLAEWARHITVRNSRFYSHLFTSVGSEHIRLLGCKFYFSSEGGNLTQFVTGDYTNNCVVDRCELWTNAFGNFRIRGHNCQLTNNYVNTGQSFEMDGLDGFVHGNFGAGTIVLDAGTTGRLGVNKCKVIDNSGGGWTRALLANIVPQPTVGRLTAGALYSGNERQLLTDLATGLDALGAVKLFQPYYLGGTYSTAFAGDTDYQATSGSFENAVGTTPATADTNPVAFITSTRQDTYPNNVYLDNPSSGLTASQRPLLKTGIVNGHSVWRFDGSNDTLQFAGDTGFSNDGASFSYFAVVKPGAGYGAIFGSVASGRTWLLTGGGLPRLEQSFVGTTATGLTVVPTTKFSLVGMTYNNVTGKVRFWLNGALDTEVTVTPVAYGSGLAYLGSRGASDTWFQGDIAWYWKGVGVISDADVAKLSSDLNDLFNLYTPAGDTAAYGVAALATLKAPVLLGPTMLL